MTTPLPTPPSSTRPATFNSDCDAFLAALPLFQTEMDALAASLSPLGRNMLINGAFTVNNRVVGSIADGKYGYDRWYFLNQLGNVTVSGLSSPEDSFQNGIRITQSQGSAQRFGFAQPVEYVNCIYGKNQSAVLSGRVRCSVSTNIKYAILGWDGTSNVPTKDVVNNWSSGTYSAGNFFLASNVEVLAIGTQAVSANTWTQLADLVGNLGSSFNNLYVFVWTETALANGVTLDCDYMQLEVGASSTPLERRLYSAEELNCHRYAQRHQWGNTEDVCILSATATLAAQGKVKDLYCQMLSSGTITVVTGNCVGWKVSSPGPTENGNMTTFDLASVNGQSLVCTSGVLASGLGWGGWTAGQAVRIAASASGFDILVGAELGGE